MYQYVNNLPLADIEAETLNIIHSTFKSLENATQTIDNESRHQMLKYQYKLMRKLARKIETRVFRQLTPFDAFIYRYLLKGRYMLPNYRVYNFSNSEIKQRLAESVSLGTQEMIFNNGLMPSMTSKLMFHSFNGLLDVARNFLHTVKPKELEEPILNHFLDKVFENYNFIPYHNFAHAVSVLQFFDHMVKQTPLLGTHFSEVNVFWVYIACICHDMTHYGKNNVYYIKRKHNLAFKSFEKSVLEHYHCEKTLKIMAATGCDIMGHIDVSEKAKFKQIIIESILATDMAKHFTLLEEFNFLDLAKPLESSEFLKLSGFLVHSSDVANPALDFDNYLLWGELVSQEFHLQSLSEKKYNLAPTPFLQYGGREAFLKGQVGFINGFVMPLFKAVTVKTQNGEFENQCVENINTLKLMLEEKTEENKVSS